MLSAAGPARAGEECPMDQHEPPPSESEPDYTIERGLLVYTAAFHLKRGTCCGSGCRHCPFEPRHVAGSRAVAPPRR